MKRPPSYRPLQVFASLAGNSRPWNLVRSLRSNNPSDLQGELNGIATLRRNVAGTNKTCVTELIYTEEGDMPGMGVGATGVRWSRKYIWRFTRTAVELDGAQAKIENPASDAGIEAETETGKGMEGDLSIWFVKPTAPEEVDYLFHRLEFDDVVDDGSSTSGRSLSAQSKAPVPPAVPGRRTRVLVARGYHLCVRDGYDSFYSFRLADDASGEVVSWASRHLVSGPAKDQDIVNMYSRPLELDQDR